MTSDTFLSPPSVARMLGCKPDKIRLFIANGELAAINLASRRGGRPRYRVSAQALEQFLRRREVIAAPKGQRRRRREPAAINHYYRSSQ